MPVLKWIGKDAVARHDAEVPFRLLHDVPELACGDAESGNLIVEGDNLLALKALLPHYVSVVMPAKAGIVRPRSCSIS